MTPEPMASATAIELAGKTAKGRVPSRTLVQSALGFAMFIMGGCGLVYEYLLSVLGNHLMGSSHEQIFVVIGIMLFAMGIAAALQGQFRTALIERFLILQLALGLVGGTAVLLTYAAFVFLPNHQIIHYGLAFLVGLLVGLEIPLLLRINEAHSKDLRTNLSWILSLDYVGALAGALLFAYVLLRWTTLERVGLTLGAVNTGVGLLTLSALWPLVRRPLWFVVAAVLQIGLFGVLWFTSAGWMAGFEQRCYQDPITYRTTTPYQRIVLTQKGEHLRLYLNGHLQFSSRDEHIYHEMLVHPAMAAAARRDRVLILGGGDGLALREVLKWSDVKSVDLVDIDAAVIELSRTHPALVQLNEGAFKDVRIQARASAAVKGQGSVPIRQHNRLAGVYPPGSETVTAVVQAFAIDADLYIRDLGEDYDVAILDFPDPTSLEVAKLFSVEFYRALRQRLSEGAVISVQASSPVEVRRAYLIVGKTLETAGFQALPYHEHIPSFGEWGFWLAMPGEVSADALKPRLMGSISLPSNLRYLTNDVLRAAFVFGRGWLERDETIRPNTRMQPVLVEAHQRRDR